MFKKLLFALLIALLPTASFAAYAHWEATATSASGNPLKGYNVKVLEYPGGTPIEIYSDDQGTIKTQPFTTSSSDGTYDFWTNADGDYKVIVYGAFGTYQTVYLSVSGTSISSSDVDISSVNLVQKIFNGQQMITATGAGNDITLSTLVSGDDIIAQAGGDISLESGAAGATAIVTETAASLFGPSGLVEVTVSDAGVQARSTADSTAMTFDTSGEDAEVHINANGGGGRVLIGANDATSGTVALSATGTGGQVTATAGDRVDIDAATSVSLASGTNSIWVYSASGAEVTGAFRLMPSAAPPVACAVDTVGTIYVDSDINRACFCNGTNYVLMEDFSTTTGCS